MTLPIAITSVSYGSDGRRRDLPPVLVLHRAELKLFGGAVQADHLAVAVGEMVPVRLRQIVQLVLRPPQAAGGDRVQQRLPQMRAGLLDQRDLRLAALAERVAELGHQFQPAGAASGDDDVVQFVGRARRSSHAIVLPVTLMTTVATIGFIGEVAIPRGRASPLRHVFQPPIVPQRTSTMPGARIGPIAIDDQPDA